MGGRIRYKRFMIGEENTHAQRRALKHYHPRFKAIFRFVHAACFVLVSVYFSIDNVTK